VSRPGPGRRGGDCRGAGARRPDPARRLDAATQRPGDAWDPILLGFACAVGEMQRRDADDPTSWAFQAAIHGTSRRPLDGVDWNQCQHASWYFLPWHCLYLFFLERIVRATGVDWWSARSDSDH
jgi:Common central domain of tyrosinase